MSPNIVTILLASDVALSVRTPRRCDGRSRCGCLVAKELNLATTGRCRSKVAATVYEATLVVRPKIDDNGVLIRCPHPGSGCQFGFYRRVRDRREHCRRNVMGGRNFAIRVEKTVGFVFKVLEYFLRADTESGLVIVNDAARNPRIEA
jgi:hypothetical protein